MMCELVSSRINVSTVCVEGLVKLMSLRSNDLIVSLLLFEECECGTGRYNIRGR